MRIITWIGLAGLLATTALGQVQYDRACYRAAIPPGAHDAEGIATILDERTIQVDHFTYDGTAPAVYFYLGATDDYGDFVNGIPIGPLLDRAYNDESITLELPQGQTLDGYGAISVWCAAFNVNFSSASFAAPTYPRACQQATFTTHFHDVEGVATIFDERTIHVSDFNYDGTGISVYFYLGEENSTGSFNSGIAIGPELVRPMAYNEEHVTVELPMGQSLDGYGAISVWCVAVGVSFGDGTFSKAPADFDIDGDVDGDDVSTFAGCSSGPAVPVGANCAEADLDGDGDADQSDFGLIQGCLSGADEAADIACAD